MYDRIDLTTTPARVIANSRFIAHIESGTRHLIETIGWKHESGEESEQLSLFDGSAPFTLALAGRWWLVVKYVNQQPVEYVNTEALNRYVSSVTNVDVLYWVKGRTIPAEDSKKKDFLKVMGAYLQTGDVLALNPGCALECDATTLQYVVDATEYGAITREVVPTAELPEESCVCYRFGTETWMKYTTLLHVPSALTVKSVSSGAYLIPTSSLYRRLDGTTEVRTDLVLYGHVGILEGSYPFVLRTTEDCVANQPEMDEEMFTESFDGVYGYSAVSVKYVIEGMHDETYKLCYVVGSEGVVEVPVTLYYKNILPQHINTVMGESFSLAITGENTGFADGDQAFWSTGTDCLHAVSEQATLESGVFAWAGITSFLEEDAHLCIRFSDAQGATAPIKTVTLTVVRHRAEDDGPVQRRGVQPRGGAARARHAAQRGAVRPGDAGGAGRERGVLRGLRVHVHAERAVRGPRAPGRGGDVRGLPERGEAGVGGAGGAPHADGADAEDVRGLRAHSGDRVLGGGAGFGDGDDPVQRRGGVQRAASGLLVREQGPRDGAAGERGRVLGDLQLRGAVLQLAGERADWRGERGADHGDHAEDRVAVPGDGVRAGEQRAHPDGGERPHRAVRQQLRVREAVYATGEIHQRNVAGSLIPEYYTTLQLSTAAPNSKLNVCYKMPTTTVNTGLLVDVLKIVSFELSVVPEGVTIRNIPLVGSGMTVGDKVLMVPDEAVCAGMEAMTLDVQFTRKYVAAKFEAPLLPEACTLAKMSVFYVPSSTNVPVDLALSFSVAKVSMSATVDSPYTMFGRKEMTFLVEGSTTIQQMVFFFKYTSGTDMTPYYCLTRPERAEGRIPIKCSFATVPKAGEMCMKFMFQSSSLTESVWEDIERPVDNGCYFVADYPNAHREGLQFETIAPMFSEDLSSVDVDYFRGLGTDAEVKVAVYTSSVDELTFLLAAETEEVTAVARFGDYYGPVDGVTVRVRGLKAITTTAPSILTTVMTPFTLSLVDPPAGSQVGFSASTACNEVMYINPMEAAIEVTFSRAYSHLYVCVNYGAGFRFSGLPFLTVLEFRNTLTVVANEETRVNYQYLTPTPSESCVLEPARDITVDNGCDWVSSIFVGETGLVVDGKVSTSMVFGANIAYNPTCQRPIERTNQWMVFDFGSCYHVRTMEMYLLGIETDPRFVRLESSDVLTTDDSLWTTEAVIEIVNTKAGWYTLARTWRCRAATCVCASWTARRCSSS